MSFDHFFCSLHLKFQFFEDDDFVAINSIQKKYLL